MRVRYYIEQWTDEVVPCEPTLEGWAAWLAAPCPEWNRPTAATSGERFKAFVQKFGEDIIATRGECGWTFSRPVGDADFLAVRWGPGAGWDPDNILFGEDLEQALREWFDENGAYCDDVEYIATAVSQPGIMLTYRDDPTPRLEIDSIN